MHNFEWDVLADDTLLDRIRVASGLDATVNVSYLRPLVSRILAAVGGPPLVNQPPSVSEQTSWTDHIIHEALKHTLSRLAEPALNLGFVLRASMIEAFESEAVAMPTVPINRTAKEELEALPVIGPAIAGRIIEDRTKAGRFASMEDLVSRIHGFGEQSARELSNVLRFDHVEDSVDEMLMLSDDFAVNLGKLMSIQQGTTLITRLEGALSAIAVTCASDPHPYEVAGMQHPMGTPAAASGSQSADVRLLWSSAYFEALPALFQAAASSIDVCMFHIAMPDETHPTRTLLNELVSANGRGVTVRVLMDADRPSDPYLSTVINTNTKEFLEAAGVLVRFDPAETLLHSKFIVIDKELVILGSHNWSAGSYFQFDDLSVVVVSQTLGMAQSERFGMLWAAGT